jgi:PAS domain S-box-containing protein
MRDVDVADLLELLEPNGAAVLTLDPKTGQVTPVGAAGVALLDLVALAPAAPFTSAIPSDQRESVLDVMDAAFSDGRLRALEHRLSVSGGLERRFRTTFKRSGDHFVLMMLDVTAAHHNERQWREVESWLAALGGALPFDFWICDASGRCVLQNPASARRVGNLLGMFADQALQPEVSRSHFASVTPRVLRGELVREEIEYDVGGDRKTFSRVVAPLNDSGRTSGVLCLDIDITEMKQAQAALLRRQRLEELGVMAATVAHEVRNPLGSIANALVLLRRQAETAEEGRALCRIIEDEIQRLDELVVSLLDLARPMRPTLEHRSLSGVVEEALAQTLRADPDSARIAVIRNVDAALGPVLLDARLLNLGLTNIFRNALQAIAGEGELHVTVDREESEKGGWARVHIRDTGPGIPAEVKERLFEPFSTTRSKGSGLGLAIVRRTIDAHQGQVELNSDGGRGTTCIIRLPLVDGG